MDSSNQSSQLLDHFLFIFFLFDESGSSEPIRKTQSTGPIATNCIHKWPGYYFKRIPPLLIKTMGFNKKKESGMPPFVSVCIVWFLFFFSNSQIVVGGICCHDNTRFPISSDTNTDPLRLQHTKRRIAYKASLQACRKMQLSSAQTFPLRIGLATR